MKCRCGAWSDVLETRTRADGVKRRRYVCANGHRFSTIEVLMEPKKGVGNGCFDDSVGDDVCVRSVCAADDS